MSAISAKQWVSRVWPIGRVGHPRLKSAWRWPAFIIVSRGKRLPITCGSSRTTFVRLSMPARGCCAASMTARPLCPAAYRTFASGAGGYVWAATNADGSQVSHKGEGLQSVHGNGFGCVVLRSEVVRDMPFTASIDAPGFDVAFYHRLPQTGLRAKIDWSIECERIAM